MPRMRPEGRRSPHRVMRGQAMIETILMMWGLFIILAIMIQVFLIDQHAFRLATSAHARLFSDEAFPKNSPFVAYSGKATRRLEGPDAYVPVINYFRLYGLTDADLRIRSTRDDRPKQLRIGRGTRADPVAGLMGIADPSIFYGMVAAGKLMLDDAKQKAEEAQTRAAGR